MSAAALISIAGWVGRMTADSTTIELDDERAISASIDRVEAVDGKTGLNHEVRVDGHAQNIPQGSEIRLLIKAVDDTLYYINAEGMSVNDDGNWSEQTTIGDPGPQNIEYEIDVVLAPEDVLEDWDNRNTDGSPELAPEMVVLATRTVSRSR